MPEEINLHILLGGQLQKVPHEHAFAGIAGGAARDSKTAHNGISVILVSLQLFNHRQQNAAVMAAEFRGIILFYGHWRPVRPEEGEFGTRKLEQAVALLISPIDCRFHHAGTSSFALHHRILVNDAVGGYNNLFATLHGNSLSSSGLDV
ncbi:hypothetical protein D3C73_1308480 [compost metagenome]